MSPIIIFIILILSYLYLSRKTYKYEILFMIVILIVTESTHILEGIKSKSKNDPAIPSLDDSDFAEKAYNYHKNVTCGTKGAKKAADIIKEINDAPKEQKDEIINKYNFLSIFWAAYYGEGICVDKTIKQKDIGDMFGKHRDDESCKNIIKQLSATDKVPKEIQDLNKKYLAFAKKTYCS
jgi:hypothetical protein